jgi:hypothetical protein
MATEVCETEIFPHSKAPPQRLYQLFEVSLGLKIYSLFYSISAALDSISLCTPLASTRDNCEAKSFSALASAVGVACPHAVAVEVDEGEEPPKGEKLFRVEEVAEL